MRRPIDVTPMRTKLKRRVRLLGANVRKSKQNAWIWRVFVKRRPALQAQA